MKLKLSSFGNRNSTTSKKKFFFKRGLILCFSSIIIQTLS
nr:MAG TPA: hypothetical protein [Caudoviricetes sp.]